MITATLFREFYGQREYKTVRVRDIEEISRYTGNGWRCVGYNKAMF